MGYENNFEGGLSFQEVNTSLKEYNGMITLLGFILVLIILIIILGKSFQKQREKFRHLLINRAKLANKDGQQKPGCPSLNRGSRITESSWSQIYDPNAVYEETPEIKQFKNNYINQKVMDEIDNTNNKINNITKPISNETNDANEINKIIDEVKKELEENTTSTNEGVIQPNGSVDPLDTKNLINNYVVGNMVDGNREPIIQNGPLQREEFWSRNNKRDYDWMSSNIGNTEKFTQMNLKMKEYASKHGFN